VFVREQKFVCFLVKMKEEGIECLVFDQMYERSVGERGGASRHAFPGRAWERGKRFVWPFNRCYSEYN
jgi:hypothetical protein